MDRVTAGPRGKFSTSSLATSAPLSESDAHLTKPRTPILQEHEEFFLVALGGLKLAKILKIKFPVNFYPSKCPAPHTPYELPEEGKWKAEE